MPRLFWILVVTVAVSIPVAAEAHDPPAGSPLANREHPRLWMTQASLSGLRTKIATTRLTDYADFVYQVDKDFTMPDGEVGSEYHAVRAAFLYVIGPIPGVSYARPMGDYLSQAKARLLYMTTVQTNNLASRYSASGLTYDWLHSQLTPAERTAVVNGLKLMDSQMAGYKNPWDDRSTELIQARILAGLAFWGDGIDDAAADAMVNAYATHVLSGGLLDAGNMIGDDGACSEGIDYCTKGSDQSQVMNILRILEAWRTANGLSRDDVYSGSRAAVLRYFPQYFLYLIRPHAVPKAGLPGGHEWVLYKTHFSEAYYPAAGTNQGAAILAGLRLFKDIDPAMASLAQWLLANRVGPVSPKHDNVVLSSFVLAEDVTPRSPSELGLPLTKTFRGLGWTVMRTGWDSLSDTMVTFIASPWMRSFNSNFNNNSFTIDFRGPLALNSGFRTHHSYANSTWAANTLIFPDSSYPDGSTTFPDKFDFGGQRRSFSKAVTSSTMLVPGSMYDLGGTKRAQAANPSAGLDFDYIFGDATRAYNGPENNDGRNNTVKLFTRQLVYFRRTSPAEPDRIVVYDRAETTDPKFQKRWLLHVPGVPDVDGVETFVRDGKWSYSGASLVTATNTMSGSSGRLYSRTLLPAQRTIVKIGGPGHEFEDPYGANDATNFNPSDPLQAQYTGTHRIEVIPAVASTFDTFLHVLEVTEPSAAGMTETAIMASGATVTAMRIGQRAVSFSRLEGAVTNGQFTFDKAGTYKVLLCDLTPGAEYLVGPSQTPAIATAAGLIYVDASVSAGTVFAFQATGGHAAPPSSPTNVRIVQQ